jgi:DNA-binding CsgD family transcriptional regulator
VQRYCALVYDETGSYQETARRLGLDRRTVKAKIGRPVSADEDSGDD